MGRLDRHMFFDSWPDLAHVVLVGTLSYVALVLLLRVSGKRTLSKMNAFDMVVTITIGSTLASGLLNRSGTLSEVVLALVLLVALQWVVALSTVHVAWFRRLVKSEPSLLFRDGRFLWNELRKQRIVEEEVTSAIRQHGFARLDEVGAVILETDGSFSVLGRDVDPRLLAGVVTGDAQ